MMRSVFVALAAAAALGLPTLAVANDKHDRDDRYDHDDRDRHHDRDRHDRYDDKYDDYDDDKYGHGKDYDDRGYDYDYDDYDDKYDRDYDDHGKKCPEDFDLVIAVTDDDGDKDRDGIVCCKVVHHGWRTALVCVDKDFDKDDEYY